MAKFKTGKYTWGSFSVGSNGNFNLIMCKGSIVILLKCQRYVLDLHHTYLFHSGMYIIEATIRQSL